MMRALGELLLSNTEYHTFIEFVQDYMGEKPPLLPVGRIGSVGSP